MQNIFKTNKTHIEYFKTDVIIWQYVAGLGVITSNYVKLF